MNTAKVHNFLFHPFSQKNSKQKFLSLSTIVALSVFSGGAYLILLAVVNLYDRKFEIQKSHPKIQKTANPILKTKIPDADVPILKPEHPDLKKEKLISKTELIQKQHAKFLAQFEKWAKANSFQSLNDAHFDWWIFPVNYSSGSYQDLYQLNRQEIEELKNNEKFMKDYRRGVELVLLGWGWDINTEKLVEKPVKGQEWRGYGVRLGKMSDSLHLFGENALHEKVRNFFINHCKPKHPDEVEISDFDRVKKTVEDRIKPKWQEEQ